MRIVALLASPVPQRNLHYRHLPQYLARRIHPHLHMSASDEPHFKKTKADDDEEPTTSALTADHPLWDASWTEGVGEATAKKRSAPSAPPDFVLYSSWFCPFAQRAWIAAEESGANYQWVEINPYQVDPNKPGGYTKLAMSKKEKQARLPDFMETSPRGLVPAIRHDKQLGSDRDNGTSKKNIVNLWESMPVVEYIDAVWGGGTLVNRSDPYDVARQQIWAAHCTDRVQKNYYRALVAQDKADEHAAVQDFNEECRSLARAMSDEGPYFNGAHFSLVDVALAPFWQRIEPVGGKYFGLKLPREEPEFQRLDQWWEAVRTRPSVAATIVCEARLVSTYSDYAKGRATSDAARNYIK
jgi:glutathione S-transferase